MGAGGIPSPNRAVPGQQLGEGVSAGQVQGYWGGVIQGNDH